MIVKRQVQYACQWLLVVILILVNFPTYQRVQAKGNLGAVNINVPFISQTALRYEVDANGKPYTLGNSSTLLWNYGCGVSSIAMVYSYYGLQTSLIDMNAALKREGGFYSDLLYWKIYDASLKEYISNPGIIRAGYPWIKNFQMVFTVKPEVYKEKIDSELNSNHPVIVFLKKKHYVVLTGRDENGNYLVNDPWQINEEKGKGILIQNNITKFGFNDIRQIIFFSPEEYAPTNGIPVSGKISEKYISLGGSRGFLGNPISKDDGSRLLGGLYRWQEFEQGMIVQIQDQTIAIYGVLWEKLQSYDNLTELGFPLGDIYNYPAQFGGDVWQVDFENGSMIWREFSNPDQVEVYRRGDSFLEEFFNSSDFNSPVAHYRYTPSIRLDLDYGRPGPWINQEKFSVRWTGTFTTEGFLPWPYTFKVPAIGFLTVWIDGQKAYQKQDNRYSGRFTKWLRQGEHTIVVEYNKNLPETKIKVSWNKWLVEPVGAANDNLAESIDSLPAPVSDYLSVIPTPEPNLTPTAAANNPEQTVRDFFEGLNSHNIDQSITAIDPGSRIWVRPVLEGLFSALQDSQSTVILTIDETSHTLSDESNATVTVSGVVDVFVNNGSSHTFSQANFTLPLIKQDGTWFINLNIDKLVELLKELQYYLW